MTRAPRRVGLTCALTGALIWAAATLPATAKSVLMISVDGMKPEYVTHADEHGLKIPFLRSMMRDGVYAEGVTGVFPTVTYPSHTTLVTGVWPAEHGIYNNLEFDPQHQFADAWFWFAPRIRVPTLWQVAHDAHLTTASVGWPVSVGAGGVDWLIPEYWRISRPTEFLNPSDANLVAAVSRPEGMMAAMQARLGPYMAGNDPSAPGDEIKTRYALHILRKNKPQFMTIHLSSLDEEEHEHGPFSIEANRDLEVIDGWLSQLCGAARANDPDAVAVVVSDHGFLRVTHRVNLYAPFLEAGLMQPNGGIWQAQPWPAGGMASVMLHSPVDPGTERRVREMLSALQGDTRNGIAAILERDAIKARGGFPDAAFLIVMQPGYTVSTDMNSARVTEVTGTPGSHGFSPEFPEMRAAFFMSGRSITRPRDVGVIDMRQIAPTVAGLLGISMPSAKAEALRP